MNTQLILRTGTKAEYLSLPVKDNDTLYFTTDTHEIFKGSVLYCETKIVENSPIFKDINEQLDLRHGKGLSNDNGVLTLNINSDDKYLKFDSDKLTTKLPEYNDNTKNNVLSVNSTATGLEWKNGVGSKDNEQILEFDNNDNLTTKIPEYNDTSKNKVLAVKEDATGFEWKNAVDLKDNEQILQFDSNDNLTTKIPAYTEDDSKKVLTVKEDTTGFEWKDFIDMKAIRDMFWPVGSVVIGDNLSSEDIVKGIYGGTSWSQITGALYGVGDQVTALGSVDEQMPKMNFTGDNGTVDIE